MNKILILALVLVSLLVLSGCFVNPEPLGEAAAKKPGGGGTSQCKTGQTKLCTTSENCPGIQQCINKKWGACNDIANDNCPIIPECANGATQNCTTTESCPGTQTCVNNLWGACNDNPNDGCPFVPDCTNGQTQNCITSESCPGTQTCANNLWQSCNDVPNDNCPVVPEPYITVSQINPVTDMNIPRWEIFSYMTSVTCHDGNCGAITSTLYFIDVNQTMVSNSGTPFYTTSSNPQICPEMHSGETCNNTWQVTVTGAPYNTYQFFAEYHSFDANIGSKTTPVINITIDVNSS